VTDYRAILPPETWEFIRRTETMYPPDAASLTIPEQRAIYDQMAVAFHRGRPGGLAVEDAPLAGVPCRFYGAPGAVTVLWLHGGGHVVGSLDSHDDALAEIAAATGMPLVSADYRLAPEHPHPAAFEDVLAVTRALAATGTRIILAGDSAGANLVAAAAHRLRGEIAPLGMVLIYPGLGGNEARGSYLTHADAPMLTLEDVAFYARIRHPGGVIPAPDPSFAPLSDGDFTGLPPVLIASAECDPLADDGRDYCDAVRVAGGRAICVCEPGLVHGYLRGRAMIPAAATSFARIISGIAGLAQGTWPPEGWR
jgi:acetyl esterase